MTNTNTNAAAEMSITEHVATDVIRWIGRRAGSVEADLQNFSLSYANDPIYALVNAGPAVIAAARAGVLNVVQKIVDKRDAFEDDDKNLAMLRDLVRVARIMVLRLGRGGANHDSSAFTCIRERAELAQWADVLEEVSDNCRSEGVAL